MTGSSRTDSGVHALQNYFHFNVEDVLEDKILYNLNSILPHDIAVRKLIPVKHNAHCRFDAIARKYAYHIYHGKDPFIYDRAYYFPYPVDMEMLERSANLIMEYSDFTAFSKRNTQVKTFECSIMESYWQKEQHQLIYHVKANRFLRGMVRGLVGTMLQVGRGKKNLLSLKRILENNISSEVDFSVPGHGLYLEYVDFGDNYFSMQPG